MKARETLSKDSLEVSQFNFKQFCKLFYFHHTNACSTNYSTIMLENVVLNYSVNDRELTRAVGS